MSYQEDKEKNLQFFTRLLDESQDEHHMVAQSKISHRKRFEKLLELGDFNGKRLLDVGCGVGGFVDFLHEKGILCDYFGVDINHRMIQEAQKRHPNLQDQFVVFDIMENPFKPDVAGDFDYVFANGPLNLKLDSAANVTLTLHMMERMFTLAHIGMAITMTSALTKKPNEETFYYHPRVILEETLKFCPNTRFDHTYLPHDFAIFCYKKDLYDF